MPRSHRRRRERARGRLYSHRHAESGARGASAAAAFRNCHAGLGDTMFYQTDKNDHGLPHDPFKAIVAPRPIGWITSMSAKGEVNLAPYSFFNGITDKPPIVMFSSEGAKDSVVFAEETKEFVCSLATFDLQFQMNGTSAPLPRGENEMIPTGLEAAPSKLVKPPRVAASPCALECKWM